MSDPIIQSRAGFCARRSMVEYLERELTLELQAAEQGLPLHTQPPPVLGAYVLALALGVSSVVQRVWARARARRTTIPRVFYRELS